MKKSLEYFLFLLFLIFTVTQLSSVLYQKSSAQMLSQLSPESDSFRQLKCSERFLAGFVNLEEQSGMEAGEILTILLPKMPSGFLAVPDTYTDVSLLKWKRVMLKYNCSAYEKSCLLYGAIFNDLSCMPVDSADIVYENSWMFERNYGGTRGHEGTDLMPPENVPGYYRILSMTDGVVEKVGWLPKGGYRIGIRSPSGGYFYYAHLDSYSREFAVGEEVAAGELLGFMGDTGYGEEGTRGKFDVHLHLGIYIRTENTEEISVNPYWVLKYLEMHLGMVG